MFATYFELMKIENVVQLILEAVISESMLSLPPAYSTKGRKAIDCEITVLC